MLFMSFCNWFSYLQCTSLLLLEEPVASCGTVAIFSTVAVSLSVSHLSVVAAATNSQIKPYEFDLHGAML